MAKVEVHYAQFAREMFERMSRDGVLLASLTPEGRANAMSLGWGAIGTMWAAPVFIVMVRPSRYTFDCIEHTNDFTVNLQPADAHKAVAFCGSCSGRQRDKLAEIGWETVPAEAVETPLIKPCLLHYECRVVHKRDVDPDVLAPNIAGVYYPSGDVHRAYYGEILRVTAEESFVEEVGRGV